jgi:hypothetical protein
MWLEVLLTTLRDLCILGAIDRSVVAASGGSISHSYDKAARKRKS